MTYQVKKIVYLVTLIGSVVISLVGYILFRNMLIWWIGLGLWSLATLFEFTLLRCPHCNERIRGKGLWISTAYLIRQMKVKNCQNMACRKPLV